MNPPYPMTHKSADRTQFGNDKASKLEDERQDRQSDQNDRARQGKGKKGNRNNSRNSGRQHSHLSKNPEDYN